MDFILESAASTMCLVWKYLTHTNMHTYTHKQNIKLKDFRNGIKIGFESLNEWFRAKRLSNFDKTYFIYFTNKSSPQTMLTN